MALTHFMFILDVLCRARTVIEKMFGKIKRLLVFISIMFTCFSISSSVNKLNIDNIVEKTLLSTSGTLLNEQEDRHAKLVKIGIPLSKYDYPLLVKIMYPVVRHLEKEYIILQPWRLIDEHLGMILCSKDNRDTIIMITYDIDSQTLDIFSSPIEYMPFLKDRLPSNKLEAIRLVIPYYAVLLTNGFISEKSVGEGGNKNIDTVVNLPKGEFNKDRIKMALQPLYQVLQESSIIKNPWRENGEDVLSFDGLIKDKTSSLLYKITYYSRLNVLTLNYKIE